MTGLNCAECGSDDVKVYDSRPHKKLDCVVRHRKCSDCGEKFKTLEIRYAPEVIEYLEE